MDLDANSLLAGLLVSSIGFVLFVYGRRMGRIPHVISGVVLLVYPYFFSSTLVILGMGALFLLLLWLAVGAGI